VVEELCQKPLSVKACPYICETNITIQGLLVTIINVRERYRLEQDEDAHRYNHSDHNYGINERMSIIN
jgi:hypothetical protein